VCYTNRKFNTYISQEHRQFIKMVSYKTFSAQFVGRNTVRNTVRIPVRCWWALFTDCLRSIRCSLGPTLLVSYSFLYWWLSIRHRSRFIHSCIFHPCIFHFCYLLPHFPLLHFPPLHFWPYRIFHSCIFSRPAVGHSPDILLFSIFYIFDILASFLNQSARNASVVDKRGKRFALFDPREK